MNCGIRKEMLLIVITAVLFSCETGTQAGQWKTYLESNGMPCQEVSALAVDGDLLWVGTFGKPDGCGKLLSLDMGKEEWKSYSPEVIHCDRIFSICAERNRVWFGTDSGFVCFTKATSEWKQYPPAIGLPGAEVRDIAVYGDDLWLAVYRNEEHESVGCGLTRYNLKTLDCTTFTDKNGLPSNTVRFFDIRDGIIWIGTREGLINFNPENEQFGLYFPGGHLAGDVMCMAVDGETCWFGTEKYAFSYSSTDEVWVEHDGGPTLVSCLLPTSRRVWAAPMIGLSSYEKMTGEWIEHQSRFLSETDLSGSNVKALCSTPAYLWVGTADGGLSRYAFDEDERPVSEKLSSGKKTYPLLETGFETPAALMKTLINSVHSGDVDVMLGCFTPAARQSLEAVAAEREMTPLDILGRWFEGVDSEDIPERLLRTIHRNLRDVLVEDRWLLDNRPEESSGEEIQEAE